MKMQVFQLLAWLSLVGLCAGHMRFVCPRPRSPNSGIKFGPCGGEGVEFEQEVMDVTPGPMTLHFEETVFHRGAPMRVALASADNPDDHCTLLDQAPHNEDGKVKYFQPGCEINKWPLGGCDTSYTYLTVNIPDIKCDKCFLHLISVMTDKYTPEQEPCVADGIKSTNCSTYYTCANVRIRASSAGGSKNISSCQRYEDNLLGAWPYMPADGYEMGVYRDHLGNYSAQGFIRGEEFVGDSATYMMGAEPTGPCAPKTLTCAGTTKNFTTSLARAAVAVSVLEDRMRVTALVAGESHAELRLVVNGKEFNYNISAANKWVVDTTAIVNLTSDDLPGQVSATVMSAGDSFPITCGDVSFMRLAEPNSLETKGLVLSDVVAGALTLEYIAVGVMSTQANLRGPARSSETGPIIQALSVSSPNVTNYVFGSGVVKMSNAAQVQAFWMQWLYAEIGGLRAQVENPKAQAKCSRVKTELCRAAELSPDGNPPSLVQQTVVPHGLVTLYKDKLVLQASIVLRRFPVNDSITSIALEDARDGSGITSLRVTSDYVSPRDSTLRGAASQVTGNDIPSDMDTTLNSGRILIRVKTRNAPNGLAMGPLVGNDPTVTSGASRSVVAKFWEAIFVACFSGLLLLRGYSQ